MNKILQWIQTVDNAIAALEAWYYERNMSEPAPVVQPPVQSAPVPPAVPNLLTKFCLAIQTYEGYVPPCTQYPKGTPAYQNKNPGNIRCIDGAPSSSLAVACSEGDFNVYPTYEMGFQDLEDNTIAVCRGERVQYGYLPTMTLLEYFEHRDPPSDNNNPGEYASFVAKALGVDTSFVIKGLIY